MDKIFIESGYSFDFSSSLHSYSGDINKKDNLSSVDFAIETENNVFLIEVKNQDNKNSTKKSKEQFLKDLKNELYPYKISTKFTNMLMRKWIIGDFYQKPIIFVFILEFQALSPDIRRRMGKRIFDLLPFSLNKNLQNCREQFKIFEILSIDEFTKSYPQFYIKEV